MHTYPLLKTKMSNERLMSALLLVLLLYNLPRFIATPGSILPLLLLLVIGLSLDAVAHFMLYKRPICAVSAAVTALILYTLSPDAYFWAECVALAAALIFGKFIWGGTGKNPLNPAMIGLILLAFLSPHNSPVFEPSFYLLLASLLSLPFLFIRPYAGIGLILGMALSLLLRQQLTPVSLLSSGAFFWGCLVITDPVTTTSRPAAGFIISLLAGFVPGTAGVSIAGNEAAVMPLSILVSNLLSYVADRLDTGGSEHLKKTFGINSKIKFASESALFIDISDVDDAENLEICPSCEEILRRIEIANVFGYGGAAFPSIKKIRSVMDSVVSDKHFIINAAECDPGLLHDKWLLKNRIEGIFKGIEILQKCIRFTSVTVAAKEFYGVSFPALIQSHKVADYYPAGAEKILVQAVLSKTLSGIPAANGILVLNVQTVYSICEAVLYNRKADTRFLTVADLDSRKGTVVRAQLGVSVHEIAQKVLPRSNIIYAGGSIMNARLADDNAIMDEKTTFLAVGQFKGFTESLCSQCDFCSAYCPASLRVREIAHLVDKNNWEPAERLHPENCMECGLCSAICLAGRDQAKRVWMAKYHAQNKKSYCK